MTLLQTRDLDFHASFRALCAFRPSEEQEAGVDASAEASRAASAEGIAETIAATCRIASRRSEATSAVERWLATRYAPAIRASLAVTTTSSSPHQQQATSSPSSSTASTAYLLRARRMRLVNPRFVLRRWVVDEMLDEMLEASDAAEARAVLHEIMQVSG